MAPPLPKTDDAPLPSHRRPGKKAAQLSGGQTLEGFELVGRSVTIARPRAEVFQFWRDFTQLARFMENIERVEVLDDLHSHWVVKAPAGESLEWNSVIDEERVGELLSWVAMPESPIKHAGRIEFTDASGGRGTQVTATILYDPPGGALGMLFAKLFQREPKIQARRDLRRFKQLMETGEIATSQPGLAAPRA